MKLDELYRDKRELYERAIRDVEICINDVVRDSVGEKLFRVDRITKRVKKLNSIKCENTVITQERLAELTGVSATTIGRAEKGKASPEVERKLRLFLMAARLDKEKFIQDLFSKIDLKQKPPRR